MTGQPQQPKHRFELSLGIGAHQWQDLVWRLRELAQHIEDHGPECNAVGGGAGGSYHVQIDQRLEQTEENFNAELELWLEERRKEDEASAGGATSPDMPEPVPNAGSSAADGGGELVENEKDGEKSR